MKRSLRAVFGLGPLGSLPLPGMWWSLAGLLLAWWIPETFLLPVTAVLSLAGLAACPAVVRVFAAKDPQWFNWDEVCGMCLSVAWAPKEPFYYFTAFLLFRLFDSWKPGPVRWAEERTGPTGIMWDDLVAGLLSAACLGWAASLFFIWIPA